MSEEKTVPALKARILELEAMVRKLQREVTENGLDELTGFMRRKMFWSIVEEEILICHRGAKTFSIMVIDINDLKKVNDALGHRAGDSLIIAFAKFLKQSLRDCDMIARTGGDEFMVFLPGEVGHNADCARERLCMKLARAGKAIPYFSGAAIGTAMFSEGLATLEELYEAADKDMYLHKKELKKAK